MAAMVSDKTVSGKLVVCTVLFMVMVALFF